MLRSQHWSSQGSLQKGYIRKSERMMTSNFELLFSLQVIDLQQNRRSADQADHDGQEWDERRDW